MNVISGMAWLRGRLKTVRTPCRTLSDTIVVVAVAQPALVSLILASVAEVVRQSEIDHVAVVLYLRNSRVLIIAACGAALVYVALRIANEDAADAHLKVLVFVAYVKVEVALASRHALAEETFRSIVYVGRRAPVAQHQISRSPPAPCVEVVRVAKSAAFVSVIAAIQRYVEHVLYRAQYQVGRNGFLCEALLVSGLAVMTYVPSSCITGL